MVTIIVTMLLIYGVKFNKSFFFLPWLVENITGVVVGFGVAGVKLLSGTTNRLVFEALQNSITTNNREIPFLSKSLALICSCQ